MDHVNNNEINFYNLSSALTNEKENGFVTIDSKTNKIKQNKGLFTGLWQWLTGNENKRLISIVNAYVTCLEKINDKRTEDPQNTLDTLAYQIDQIMEKIKPGSEKKLLEKSVTRIRAAVHHRSPVTLKQKERSLSRFNQLKQWAEKFKKDEKLYKGDDKEYLTELDEHALKHASQYDYFFNLLENDESLRVAFLKWTIRDGNSAKTFILFPKLADRISACALSPRYGYFHRQYMERKFEDTLKEGIVKPLEVKKDENGYQVLGSFIDAKGKTHRINLLDSTAKVNMCSEENKLEYSVDSIFKSIQGKKKDIIGDFEMFNGAIHNWNSQKFGSVKNTDVKNPKHTNIDFAKANWWTQMPAFETLSIDEAKDKFGGDLDGTKWGVYAVGARDQNKVDFGGNHGYKMILIPTEDGQNYNVYPIGTFTKEFPQGGLGLLGFLLNSVEADLRFDENVYYSHRQKAGVLFEMKPEDGQQYMDLIKRKLRMSLGEDSPFNCKKEKEAYKDKFVARRRKEMGQYATKYVKGLKGNSKKEIDLKDIMTTSLKTFDHIFESEILDKKALKEMIKNLVENINSCSVTLDEAQQAELCKKLEEKVIRDHERLYFHLNQKNYMFQFTDKNCAWNVQEELEEILGKESEGGVVPDLFSMKLTDMQPSNFMKYFIGFARILPGPLGRAVIRTGCCILGAGRSFQYGNDKKHKQSVKDTRFWKTAEVYSPAHFVNNIIGKKIEKVYSAAV